MRFYSIVSLNFKLLSRKWHAYLIALLQQHLIVFTQSHTEYNGGHVLEAMNPLLPLAPLATHIEHAVQLVSDQT